MAKRAAEKKRAEPEQPAAAAAPQPPPPPRRWAADRVERRRVDDLYPYARNVMMHTNAQVDAIARAIGRFGWTNPVILDERGEIIAGHGRVLAARRLGLESVPAVVAEDWTPEEKRAYRIWDNQSSRISEWSSENLRIELSELKGLNFDLSLTGFDPKALVEFMTIPKPPDSFPAFGENIATEYCCPKCRYRWSGAPDPGKGKAGEPAPT